MNGCCGIWIFKTTHKDPFHVACCTHDSRYEQIKRKEITMTFKQADEEFKRNLERAIETYEFLDGKDKPLLRIRAKVYYKIVVNLRRIIGELPVIE